MGFGGKAPSSGSRFCEKAIIASSTVCDAYKIPLPTAHGTQSHSQVERGWEVRKVSMLNKLDFLVMNMMPMGVVFPLLFLSFSCGPVHLIVGVGLAVGQSPKDTGANPTTRHL